MVLPLRVPGVLYEGGFLKRRRVFVMDVLSLKVRFI